MPSKAISKRLTAIIAAVALLLCQSAALAQWSNGTADPVAGAASEPPCHAAPQSSEPASDNSRSGCHDQTVSAEHGATIYDVTDLPVLPAAAFLAVAADRLPLPEPPLLQAQPPPLRIVHCCLRN